MSAYKISSAMYLVAATFLIFSLISSIVFFLFPVQFFISHLDNFVVISKIPSQVSDDIHMIFESF